MLGFFMDCYCQGCFLISSLDIVFACDGLM